MVSTSYRIVAYYTRCREAQAKELIKMARAVACMGDGLAQFEFNNQQISVRIYPVDNSMRIGLVDQRVNIIICTDNALPIIEMY